MMKILKAIAARGLQALCVLALTGSFAATAKNLKFADSFPTEHYLSAEGMQYWMTRVEEITDGDITFTHFPAEQLAKAGNILGKVRDGVVDAGYVGIGYVTDRMPLNGVSMLPGLAADTVTGSKAYWDLVKDGQLRKEFEDSNTVPLFAVILPPYQLVLNEGPIDSINDFKGLKIRSSGTLNLSVNALGATPVSMAATEIYLGMQRGTLDGTLLPPVSVNPYNIQEIMESTSTNGQFGTFAVTAAMDADVFNSLSKAEQKAVRQAGEDTVLHLSQYMRDQANAALDDFRKQGIEVYEFSPELRNQMTDELDKVQTQWVERMTDRGLDGDGVLKAYKAALQEQRGRTQ